MAKTCCPVVELRQYTLYRGQRETLIDLFDREFVETQEDVGIRVIGQFRDLDRPDHFVWLRGYPDMDARARSLAAFYDGPVWAAHRDAANATMIDSDDVLLLRMARSDSGFALGSERPTPGQAPSPRGLVTATVLRLTSPATEGGLRLFETTVATTLARSGGDRLGLFVTETSENTFPRLPVREGEWVLVSFDVFSDVEDHARATRSTEWQRAASELAPHLAAAPEVLRLRPTSRSLLA